MAHPPRHKPPAYTKEQLDACWTEHTAPDGTKYYHNSLSKESTYLRPATATATLSVALPTSSAAGTARAVSAVWKEYTDGSSGNTYYSNGVVTQWTRPVELDVVPEFTDTAPIEESLNDTLTKKKRRRDEEEVQYESKEDAAVALKEFLVSRDVGTNLKWAEVSKMFAGHSHLEAIGKQLSTGERRQALAEYQTKRQNELKNLKRQERQKAKDDFTRMLTEVLPTIKVFSAWNSNWSDIRQMLSRDDRFESIKDESARESLFVDFCDEFRKREDRRRRAIKRDAGADFLSFLKDSRKAGRLSLLSKFHDFQASLSRTEKETQGLKFLEHLDESDQRRLFNDYVAQAPAVEEEASRMALVAVQRGSSRRVDTESSDEEGEIV